jgi:hypothetical protein
VREGGEVLIRQYRLRSGVTVNIYDDRMAKPGSEEEKRYIENQRRIAREIMLDKATREAETNGMDKSVQGI